MPSSPPALLSILEKSAGYLAEKGIESSRLNAEKMMAHVLGISRLQLYLQHDRPLEDLELQAIRDLLKRRSNGEPLQYLLGSVGFRNLEVMVGPGVLIPRPETEIVVEYAQNRAPPQARVLDFGTGSACIALSLLQERPDLTVVAVEKDHQALTWAAKNCRSGNALPVLLVGGDSLAAFTCDFDLLVSNPPYIPTREIPDLQKEVTFEPTRALDGGQDGLDCYRLLAKEGKRLLKPGGWMVLEIGETQDHEVKAIFDGEGEWGRTMVFPDLAGKPRVFETQKASAE